jgi:hypothetical protein
MITEHVWITVSIILWLYAMVTDDKVFIAVNLGFIFFNIYQLRKHK